MGNPNAYLKKIKTLAAKNLAEGEEFLQKNSDRAEVNVLPSGLQYEIVVKGNGSVPKLNDSVLCHYSGRLSNGEVFDSSYKRKKPESFPVKDLIIGWQEALQLMPVGSKWIIYIPSNLAYGFKSLTTTSGGNLTLIFEMELLTIL